MEKKWPGTGRAPVPGLLLLYFRKIFLHAPSLSRQPQRPQNTLYKPGNYLAGIRSTWPMLSRSLVSPFRLLIASTVVPYLRAICHRLSPGRTVYSVYDGPGEGEGPGDGTFSPMPRYTS